MKRLATYCLLLIVGGAIWTGQTRLWGCAAALPKGHFVSIMKEFALIIWEPDNNVQHFIRVADLETDAKELGFLVPTPTVPELFEADADSIAAALHSATKPRRVTQVEEEVRFGLGPWGSELMETSAAAPSSVQVLGEYNVAGYEASVLRAEDPNALKQWLDEHEYATTETLEAWLKIYTDQKWVITAFKVAEGSERQTMRTQAVRMTFKSERPFYPYREPLATGGAPAAKSRLLRLFLLADKRYDATIGESKNWPANTVFSKPIKQYQANQIASNASLDSVPLYLTEFEDHSSPRPGTDELYFAPTADQTHIERRPRVVVRKMVKYFPGWPGAILIGCIGLPVSLGGIGGWLWLRRRNSTSS